MATVLFQSPAVNSLSPVEMHSLVVASKDAKDFRDELQPGVHEVDFVARIRGTVTVKPDTTSASNVNVGGDELLAYVLSKLNEVTRESILAGIVDAFNDNGQQMPEADEATVLRVKEVQKQLRRSVVSPRRGAVSGTIFVESVDEDNEPYFSVVG